MVRLLGLLLALAFTSCSSLGPDGAGAARILFVGNSLTYTHDLPAVVEALARADGRRIETETVAGPNLSLEDHWALGGAAEQLAGGTWDVVVLQQGPSTLAESREHLIEWVGAFADLAREAGTEPAVYMVWPPEGTPITLSEQSYEAAAEAADALLLPAGRAWRLALERDPSLRLYSGDRFHPSPTGTALAALTIYGGLFDGLPRTLPDDLRVSGVSVPLQGNAGAPLVLAADRALR